MWATSQHSLVVLAAEFADSVEWVLNASPSPAHWIADVADVETCTAREWIRIGRRLTDLPVVADAFAAGSLSYSKVRTLTRVAEPDNETELVAIAMRVPAGQLGTALAVWFNRNSNPDELAASQQRQRSVRWRTDPGGMVTFTLRLPPLLAATLIAMLTTAIMRNTALGVKRLRTTRLLQYDHVPSYRQSGHTITDELQFRCAPCHHRHHKAA